MTFRESALFLFEMLLHLQQISLTFAQKKIHSFCLDERNPAKSTEGWPDSKESACFLGQPGGRGETQEESK